MAVIKTPVHKKPTEIYISSSSKTEKMEEILQKAKSHYIQMIPFDIEKLIRIYGITIVKEDMDNEISGYIEKRTLNWIIGVNKYHSPRRQRFTLAHEFAHFCFDQELIMKEEKHTDAILFRTDQYDKIEARANDFAANLLMPEENFKKLINSGTNGIAELADKFDVSLAAIKFRGHNLGYKN